MLHGFGANLFTWRHLIQPFEKTYRLIAVDLKGFGKSPKPKDNRYRLQDHADLIHQFIVQHDLRGLTLIGNSMGGAVALLVSLKLIDEESDRLSTLVLIDSAGYRQDLPAFIDILRVPFVNAIAFNLLSNRQKTRLILGKSYFDDRKITEDQVTGYAEPLGLPGAQDALFSTAETLIPANIDQITERYSEINVPTLIIWGRNDDVVPLKVGQRLHGAISNSELVIIDKCGHIPHEEKPAETIKILRKFLNKHVK